MPCSRPIAIFRHAASEGPGYFADFVQAHGYTTQLFAIDAGDPVPEDARAFAGLCFMGGPMSVNDDLPWIPASLALIRQAVAENIPVIGHCLGGQLMSKALGGSVRGNPVKEIGWLDVHSNASKPLAAAWLGAYATAPFEVFHWHGETFSLPAGAQPLLASELCAHQGFVLNDRHLGLQCHVEMTEAMVQEWSEIGADEIAACGGMATVQSPSVIRANAAAKVTALHRVADQLYGRWITSLGKTGDI